jgi:hypothetical protein
MAEKLNSTLHKTLLRKELSNAPTIEPPVNNVISNETPTIRTTHEPLAPSPSPQQQTLTQKQSVINSIIYEDYSGGPQYVNEFALIKLPNNSDTEKIIGACFDSKTNKNAVELIYTTINKSQIKDDADLKLKNDQKMQKFGYTVINNEKTTALKDSQAQRIEYLSISVKK